MTPMTLGAKSPATRWGSCCDWPELERGISFCDLIGQSQRGRGSAHTSSNQLEEPRLCFYGDRCMQTVLCICFPTRCCVQHKSTTMVIFKICKWGKKPLKCFIQVYMLIWLYIWKWISTGTISLHRKGQVFIMNWEVALYKIKAILSALSVSVVAGLKG